MARPGNEAGARVPMSMMLTTRLRLEPLRAQDRAFYRGLYTSQEAMAQIGPPMTADAAEAAFDAACRHNRRERPGHRFWTVLARHTGEALGVAALRRTGNACEFGLMLAAGARDGRNAPEAVAAVIEHAFGALGVERFRVECLDNAMSRLVRRLVRPHGFDHAGAQPGRVAWELHRRVGAPGR